MDPVPATEATPPSYISFAGGRRLATGSLAAVALSVAQALRGGAEGPMLTFDCQTGGVIDIDTRGTKAQILARFPDPPSDASTAAAEEGLVPRRRGRPRLGVVAREVTLLPRHWEWLASQSGGASVVLRRLVDEARHTQRIKSDQRATQERAYRFMSAMAGDYPGFEEASRALFAGDRSRFADHTTAWPADVREYAMHLAFPEQAEWRVPS